MITQPRRMLAVLLLPLLVSAIDAVSAREPKLRLKMLEAVSVAIAKDPYLAGSQFRQEALINDAIAAGELPDPVVSLLAGNLPVDTFDIDQEPMTQVGVGISQMFPRGNTRTLRGIYKKELAEEEPLLRADREASVRSTVSQLWLEVHLAQETIRLIENDRYLFEQLVDVSKASYSSALGRARQQDFIRAQLELTKLDDRLTVLREARDSAQKRLGEWIGAVAGRPVTEQLNKTPTPGPVDALMLETRSEEHLFPLLQTHPVLLALDKRIAAMDTKVDLSRETYKPEWGVRAQYGYRDDSPGGVERSDLFSIGLTLDVPLFTANRQDKTVAAASSRAAALRTDRQLLVRRLVSRLEEAMTRLQRLRERRDIYDQYLLPQMEEQAGAALAAYNNDDGDFAEAVRARIDQLEANISKLEIVVGIEKTHSTLTYLLTTAAPVALSVD